MTTKNSSYSNNGAFWNFTFDFDTNIGIYNQKKHLVIPHDKLFAIWARTVCTKELYPYLPQIHQVDTYEFITFEFLTANSSIISNHLSDYDKLFYHTFDYIDTLNLNNFSQIVHEYIYLALEYEKMYNISFKLDFFSTNCLFRETSNGLQLVFNDCVCD